MEKDLYLTTKCNECGHKYDEFFHGPTDPEYADGYCVGEPYSDQNPCENPACDAYDMQIIIKVEWI